MNGFDFRSKLVVPDYSAILEALKRRENMRNPFAVAIDQGLQGWEEGRKIGQQKRQKEAINELGQALNPQPILTEGPTTEAGVRPSYTPPVDRNAVMSALVKAGAIDQVAAQALKQPEQDEFIQVPNILTKTGQPISISRKTGKFTVGNIPGGVSIPTSNKDENRDKYRLRNYVLDMEARDPIIKEINKKQLSFAGIDSLSNIVKEGNTVAFSGLGTQMARGMGEVGVLTDTDVKRYVESGMISQKVADRLSMWIKGKPSQATLDEMDQISKAMKQAWIDKAQPRIDMYIKRYSAIEGMTPEEFSASIGITRPSENIGGSGKLIWNPSTGKVEEK